MILGISTATFTLVTGFLFHSSSFLPSHGVGIVSLVALAIAIAGVRRFRPGPKAIA
jgi:hypothetical protein